MATTETTIEWAIGSFSDCRSLEYRPIDEPINGKYFTERPGSINAPPPFSERIPFMVLEEKGEGYTDTYVCYSSEEVTEIVRYSEVTYA